jgi:hypothetical protein
MPLAAPFLVDCWFQPCLPAFAQVTVFRSTFRFNV